MNARRNATSQVPLQGQLLRRDRRREAALFLHQGSLWVADFIDGKGGIVDAASWVRFNCSAPTKPRSGASRARMHALSPRLAATIGSLLRESAGSPIVDDASDAQRRVEPDDA